MKQFQAFIIILFLGLFLIPKDNFYAQAAKDNCCQKEQMSKCCKKNHQSSKDNDHNKKHSSCKMGCCNFCISTHTFIKSPLLKEFKLEISFYNTHKNLQYQYSDPHISDCLREIWQPPKLI